MKIYFLSSRPCALTLNGVYFGTTDAFERFIEVSLKDEIFVSFTPENAQPVSFFLTENIRFQPPKNCRVYLLGDAIALYAYHFLPTDLALRAVAQKEEDGCVATVFQQGETQLSLQSEKGFFVATLPHDFVSCEISFACGLVFLRSSTSLAVFTKTCQLLLCEKVVSFSINDSLLQATLPLLDTLGRFAQCSYQLTETSCIRTSFTLLQKQTQTGEREAGKIFNELLAYAFFESVLIGADYTSFLAPSLQEKADSLRAFLGEFVCVTPTENPFCCNLVRKKQEDLYEVSRYRVEVVEGKIVEVKG